MGSEQIRRNYPRFRPQLAGAKLEEAFINHNVGRMRDGFRELLKDERDRPKGYLRHPCTRSPRERRAYRLELLRIFAVVKLRV